MKILLIELQITSVKTQELKRFLKTRRQKLFWKIFWKIFWKVLFAIYFMADLLCQDVGLEIS